MNTWLRNAEKKNLSQWKWHVIEWILSGLKINILKNLLSRDSIWKRELLEIINDWVIEINNNIITNINLVAKSLLFFDIQEDITLKKLLWKFRQYDRRLIDTLLQKQWTYTIHRIKITNNWKEIKYIDVKIKINWNNKVIIITEKTEEEITKQQAKENNEKYSLDSLTNLYTKNSLMSFLKQAIAQAKRKYWNFKHDEEKWDNRYKVAILYLDLNQFKQINDNFWHEAWDIVLIEVSKRLKKIFRESDVIVRNWWDEFVVIMPDISNINDVELKVKLLIKDIVSDIYIDKEWKEFVNVWVSVWINYVDPKEIDNHTKIWDLIINADTAMYEAKREAKIKWKITNFKHFELWMKSYNEQIREYWKLIEDIRENDLVRICYQEIIENWKVVWYECFLRIEWFDTCEIIRCAHEAKKMDSLGEEIVSKIFRDIQETWIDKKIYINLSIDELESSNLEVYLEDMLIIHWIETNQIIFELSEEVFLQNNRYIIEKIEKLMKKWFSFIIDDFWAWTSSMHVLDQINLFWIKIDKSLILSYQDLIRDITEKWEIETLISQKNKLERKIESIIYMAQIRWLKIFAEWVERQESKAMLERLWCQMLQWRFIWKERSINEL